MICSNRGQAALPARLAACIRVSSVVSHDPSLHFEPKTLDVPIALRPIVPPNSARRPSGIWLSPVWGYLVTGSRSDSGHPIIAEMSWKGNGMKTKQNLLALRAVAMLSLLTFAGCGLTIVGEAALQSLASFINSVVTTTVNDTLLP